MTNPPVPATPLDVEACGRLLNGYADVLEGRALLGPATMAIREKEAAMFRALASALPGMGKDSERWRAFTAQHSLAHHYSWDGKPNSQLIILENGFISLDDVADRLRAARAAQPEETSRKGWIGCSTRLHASGERTDRGSEP